MALDDPHRTFGNELATGEAAKATAPLGSDAELLAGAELLPCGRPLGRAWEQARNPAAQAADPHLSHCAFCRQAVEGLTALDRATCALRAEEQPDSHALANRVINAVRAEIRLGAMLLLDDAAHDLRIAESAAAKLLRRAADSVAGARAASCRLTPTESDDALHVVAITIAAALDRPLLDRAEEVRQAVFHAAHHIIGLAVTAVDLTVIAVLDPAHLSGGEQSARSDT
ncbi:hypothetical protein J7E97_28990 [Streptomyces sp. ISL-66]|uniref:hypothetical protein n=1 Tax=Streptomyces sp. ISL-66 TaxID=2819186 RepID=UPI001BE56B7A|nr:hypothetical protein [Streptomyces sp. ISL-66]MBT2471794.1 hypothetical protein [Streptomyces sp. ISL-66]